MTTTQDSMVRSYLTRLEGALADVPAGQRKQILDGIEEHAAAALAELEAPTEADVRNVLDRLGDPYAIAADARERIGVKPSRTDKLATALLWIGALVGMFDLVMVSTSQVGPIEFGFLAVPVIALVVVAVGLRRRAQQTE